MQEWQQRVIEEKTALTEKLDKLNAFKNAAAFGQVPVADQRLLLAQYSAMVVYVQILALRIERFEST
jgi:hypothetical protein